MCIKDLSLILEAASQHHDEEAPMQRIASGCCQAGQEGGSERPDLDHDILAVDDWGSCLAMAYAQQNSLLGSHHDIILHPLPSALAVSDFPISVLRMKMNRVVKRNICIRLQEGVTWRNL